MFGKVHDKTVFYATPYHKIKKNAKDCAFITKGYLYAITAVAPPPPYLFYLFPSIHLTDV